MKVVLILPVKRHNKPFRNKENEKKKNICSGQIDATSKSLLRSFNTKAMQKSRRIYSDYVLSTCQVLFTVAPKIV